MIEHLKLKNFMAFDRLELDFSPKINVIIGENSTGKTQLLKSAYSLCGGNDLTNRLLRLFLPLDDKLGRLVHHRETDALMSARFSDGKTLRATFNTKSKNLNINDTPDHQQQTKAVFVPTKEVLSFMKGFNSLYEKYELSFDQTYHDICLFLDLPEIRPEKMHEKSKWAIQKISDICGGYFVFYGGGTVTFKTGTNEYSANAMAEGFRKAGILSRLLETGAVMPGVSGPLFWDEPEANLNPKLLELMVLILLELSRIGQQIILTTHDYVLLKWFDVLADQTMGDHVLFHSLYRDSQTKEIRVDSTSDYRDLKRNPIAEAFNDLTISQAQILLKGRK